MQLSNTILAQQSDFIDQENNIRSEIAILENNLKRQKENEDNAKKMLNNVERSLRVVLGLNQELVEISSGVKGKRLVNKKNKKSGYVVGGGEAVETAYKINLTSAAHKLMDGSGLRKGNTVEENLELVYDKLKNDIPDDWVGVEGDNNNNLNLIEQHAHLIMKEETAIVAIEEEGTTNTSTNTSTNTITNASEFNFPSSQTSKELLKKAISPPRSASSIGPRFQEPIRELQHAFISIQNEFTNLNDEYLSVVEQSKTEGGGSEDTIARMLELISGLHNKGSQLTSMKKGLRAQEFRSPVYSPGAVKRKTEALKILRDFREINSHKNDPGPHH